MGLVLGQWTSQRLGSSADPAVHGLLLQANLVGGLDFVLFSHVLWIIIPIDELIFFTGVGFNHQPEIMSHWIRSDVYEFTRNLALI